MKAGTGAATAGAVAGTVQVALATTSTPWEQDGPVTTTVVGAPRLQITDNDAPIPLAEAVPAAQE